MEFDETKGFEFPIPGNWGGWITVRFNGTCAACGGKMVRGDKPFTLVCEKSAWYSRVRHGSIVVQATVERIERGYCDVA